MGGPQSARRYWGCSSTLVVVLLVVLGQCAPLVHAARSAAHDRHNHRLLAGTTQQACQESVTILPAGPGEVVRNTMAIPSSNATGPGMCVMVTGAATLVSLSGNLTLYQATGSITFWWPGANTSVCNGSVAAGATTAAVQQFYLGRGLLLAGATGWTVTCCTPASPCTGTNYNVLHSPLLSASTPSTDWALVKGYAFNSAQKPFLLNNTLYKATDTLQSNARGCQGACATIPGCASYLFAPDASTCTFYVSEPGPQLPLVPCSSPSCQFGFRMPGSCGLTASKGISHYGKRWQAWWPGRLRSPGVVGMGTIYNNWNADTIPTEVQGLPALTVSECSCRCARVGNCTSYTWLANNQTCWLLNNVLTWVTPQDDPDPNTVLGRVVTGGIIPACDTADFWIQYDAVNSSSQRITTFPPTAFPLDVTVEQCYYLCALDPACQAGVLSGMALSEASYIKCWLLSEVSGGAKYHSGFGMWQLQRCEPQLPVPRIPSVNLTHYPGWTIQADVSALGNTTNLALLTTTTTTTTITTNTITTATITTNTTNTRRLSSSSVPTAPSPQACFQLCSSTAGCGVAIYNSNTTTCFPAYMVGVNTTAVNATTPEVALQQQQCGPGSNCLVVSREPGSCGLIASSGVLQLGQRWAGWTEGQLQGPWGMALGVAPQNQNTTAQSVSDCACQCQKVDGCIAYIYLGDVQRCWLQTRINYSNGYEADQSPLTVAGRLAVPTGMMPNCTNQTYASPNSVPYTLTSTGIQRTPNPFRAKSMNKCNEACLLEPFCVAYALSAISTAPPLCQLYSAASKTGVNTTFPDGLFSLVQRCAFIPASSAGVDDLPQPPPLMPAKPPAPPTLGPLPMGQMPPGPGIKPEGSTSNNAVVGIAIGASVGGAVIAAAIAGVLWHWRKKGQAQSKPSTLSSKAAYETDGPGKPGSKSDLTDDVKDAEGIAALHGAGTSGNGAAYWSSAVVLSARHTPSQAGHVGSKDLAAMTGLLAGDPFLMSVSSSYRWSTDPISDMVAVEEGINAGAFTAQQRGVLDAEAAATGAGPDPVQLTTAEVQQQVELMANGMIDRGATAVVFKCRWASRFGPNALLAIKCMRDPYAYHMSQMLESFKYEVEVLSKCRHPNVVRIYGYCLEPPAVCIILELLPGSLKDRLYGSKHLGNTSVNPWARRTITASRMGGSSFGANRSSVPIIPPATPDIPSTAYSRGGTAPEEGAKLITGPDVGIEAADGTGRGPAASPFLPLPPAPHLQGSHLPPFNTDVDGSTPPSLLECAAAVMSTPAASRNVAASGRYVASNSGTLVEQISRRSGKSSLASGGHSGNDPSGIPCTYSDTGSPRALSTVTSSVVGPPSATGGMAASGRTTTTSRVEGQSRSSRPGSKAGHVQSEPHVFPMAMLEVLQLGADVAAGLAHLHSKPEARLLGLQDVPGANGSLRRGAKSSSATAKHDETQGLPSGQGENEDMFVDGQSSPGSNLGRVVHRDLKPANILINSLGRAKISDLGLAREHQNTTVYTQHQGAGTLSYMAPELLKGASTSKLTDKVDIYSLGIMLWELATRQLPWKNCSDVQVQALVTSGQRPPVPGVVAGPASASRAPSVSGVAAGPASASRPQSVSGVAAGPASASRPPSVSGGATGGGGSDEMLKQLPGYTSLVRACWQDKPHRRPAAAAVHKALQKLVDAAEAEATAQAEQL